MTEGKSGAHDATVSADVGSKAADELLALWTAWMAAGLSLAPPAIGSSWSTSQQSAAPFLAPDLSAVERDPLLRAIDQIWNAHPFREIIPVNWAEIAWALRTVWLRSLANPGDAALSIAELGTAMWRSVANVWCEASLRWWGPDTSGAAPQQKASSDKRFAAPEWLANPYYRSLKDLYLLASDWLLSQADRDIPDQDRRRLRFHLGQFIDAMSPSLLLLSNPVAFRRAMETGGASLAAGARNLQHDLKQGRLSMVDTDAFAPGTNLALSPGKVIHRNKLAELIQYTPQTATVHELPLLILPPWINKYYILDLQPKNSLVRYLVAQGFTVFVVSWKNPDAAMEDTTFEDYVKMGPLEASDTIRQITGSKTANVMGYCIGGTLLAMTLAMLAAKGDRRFGTATFIVSLQDFSRVGDTAMFLGEDSIDFIEQQMMQRGYLDSREMANMFNLLRSNDLIWSSVVNNYLLGQKPPAFDLLYWNSDGTRMARAAHSWYLHNTYVENNLIVPGKIVLGGEHLDLGRIHHDVYAVGAEKDHIVPWEAAWQVTQLVGGTSRFVLASSGHIAGIINPPGGKGTYWSGPGRDATSPADWREAADRHEGSWWTDWASWLAERSGGQTKPPAIGSARHRALADAPGNYVLER